MNGYAPSGVSTGSSSLGAVVAALHFVRACNALRVVDADAGCKILEREETALAAVCAGSEALLSFLFASPQKPSSAAAAEGAGKSKTSSLELVFWN